MQYHTYHGEHGSASKNTESTEVVPRLSLGNNIMSPQGERKELPGVKYLFDAHTSKASKRPKVVLLHLWRVNVKTTGGFICISFAP